MKKTTVGLMCVMVFLVAHSSWAASKYFSYDAGTNLWDTSSAFWGTSSGGPYNATWSSNDAAFFEGASGTVSLVGAQTANSITFLAAGYVIAGSSLTLTPPALVSNAVDAVISSVIAGSAGLAKSGSGMLTLSGQNSYTNGTTVNEGTLVLAGNTNWNAGIIHGTATVNNTATLVLDHSTGKQPVASSDTINVNGGGTLALKGGDLAYIGTVNLSSANGTAAQVMKVDAGSLLRMGYNNDGTITSTGAIGNTWSAGLTLYYGTTPLNKTLTIIPAAGNNLTLSGVIADGTGYAGTPVVKAGAGTLTLSTNNTYAGNTTVSAGKLILSGKLYSSAYSASTLTITGGGVLSLSSLIYDDSTGLGQLRVNSPSKVLDNGILEYTGSSQSVVHGFQVNAAGGTLNVTSAGQTLTFTNTAQDITLTGTLTVTGAGNLTLANVLSGAGGLTKTGTGTLTITGTNSYVGVTTVSNGVLVVNNTTGSATGSSAVTVAGGMLSGAGRITGTVTVNAGGTLAPGNSIGLLTMGGLNMNAGSTNVFEFNNTPTNDMITVTSSGGLILNGGAFLLLEAGTTNDWSTPGTYTLITYAGTAGGIGTGALRVANPVAGLKYYFNTVGNTLQLTITSASASTWTGGGTDDLWQTGDNWGGVAPTSGASLVFDTVNRTQNTNDFAADTAFAIAFTNSAAAFTLNGNAITLIGDLVSLSTNPQTINNNLTLGNEGRSISVSGPLTLNGVLGGGGLVKSGSGTLSLTGANNYSGATTVNGGTLKVDNGSGSGTGSGAVTINSGAVLTGAGSLSGQVTVNAGATIAAGNGVGTLMGGSLTLNAGSTNVVEFTTTPTNDQVVLTGGLTNNGCAVRLVTNGTNGAWAQTGTYTLFQFSGTLGGSGLSAFTVANPVAGLTYYFTTNGTSLQVIIGGKPVWTGGGADDLWQTGDNWGGVAPAPGSRLFFNTSNRTGNTNDFAAGTSFAITFTNTAGAFTLNGNSINLNGDVTNLSANAQTINNDLTMTGSDRVFATSAGTMTFNGVIGGGFALIKAGTGTVTLGGTNTFSGGTSIGAGTLGLANVDNGLKTNSTVTFTGNSTFDVGGTSQLLRNVVVTNSVTGNGKGTGTLSLSGADVIIGANTLSGATSTLDLRNLANLSFADSGHKFEVSGRGAGNTIETGVLYLAGTNSITASGFYVGNEDTSGNSGGGSDYTVGKAYLGNVNIINASTFQIGNVVNEGTVQFSSGRVSPTLTLRGTSGGSSRITNMYVGLRNSPWLHNGVGTFDLVTGVTGTSTLDALITTLYIGLYQRNDNGGLLTATLTMGGGTLDATTINLGVRNSSINNASGTVTSTLTVNGGTLKVTTLTSGNYASGNQVGTMTSTVNLNSNATMRAQSLQVGSGTATRTLNWNAGTIMNYSTNTDLTINSGLTTLALLTTGLHAFDIDSGRTGTVNQTMSGTGAITKAGLGVLSLATTNNYSGSTTLSNGVLRLATVNALSTNSAMVLAGGTLDARTYTNLVGSLTMGGNATILMGTNSATTLQFQDSSALPWSGTLNLVGTLGPVSVRFGTNRLGLTSSQKNQIIIGSRHVTLDPQGYVVLSTGTLMIVQ